MATRETIARLRTTIQDNIGNKVQLKTNKGRKKVKVREGVITESYPSLFIVQVDEGKPTCRNISFKYCDILTETVEITLVSNEERIYIS